MKNGLIMEAPTENWKDLKMDKTVLIVGYGSIKRRHATTLNKVYKIKKN